VLCVVRAKGGPGGYRAAAALTTTDFSIRIAIACFSAEAHSQNFDRQQSDYDESRRDQLLASGWTHVSRLRLWLLQFKYLSQGNG
jgi:hypothetical protein